MTIANLKPHVKKKIKEEKKVKYLFQYPFLSYCWSWLMPLLIHIVLPECMRENERIVSFLKTRKKNIISSSDTLWAFRYFDHLLTNPQQG